jgi:hypothetical protein
VVRAPRLTPAVSAEPPPPPAEAVPSSLGEPSPRHELNDTALLEAISYRNIEALLLHYDVQLLPTAAETVLLGACNIDSFDDSTLELSFIEVRMHYSTRVSLSHSHD